MNRTLKRANEIMELNHKENIRSRQVQSLATATDEITDDHDRILRIFEQRLRDLEDHIKSLEEATL